MSEEYQSTLTSVAFRMKMVEVSRHSVSTSNRLVHNGDKIARLRSRQPLILANKNISGCFNTTYNILDGWQTDNCCRCLRCTQSCSVPHHFYSLVAWVDKKSIIIAFEAQHPHFVKFVLYYGAKRIISLCFAQFISSDRFEVCGRFLVFVHFCVQFINLILFDVDEVYLIRRSVAFELEFGLV